jgi:cyanuric acid amidohydrolase
MEETERSKLYKLYEGCHRRTYHYVLDHIKGDNERILQVSSKAEADPSGLIRGNRHTMNTDSDIHSTRHARTAVGGLLAGLVGDSQIYVSGGAEGQGPPGGGSLCVVYRCF